VNEHGLVFTRPDGKPLHPPRCLRRSSGRSGDSTCHRSGSTTSACATPTPAGPRSLGGPGITAFQMVAGVGFEPATFGS
jgi:hypothetical protein